MKKDANNKVKKKVKIRYGAIIVFLLLLYLIYYFLNSLINLRITNVYVLNNHYLSSQEVIELAGLNDYPSTIKNNSSKIKKSLEKNIYINKASVVKKKLTKVYIEIEENYPIFFNDSLKKTVLKDSNMVSEEFIVPVLINYVPDTIYDQFIKSMADINQGVLLKISEIKYDPNEVDEGRFLITMNDGNYVYLTLKKFGSINSYLDIVVNFKGKKGILYLDSGSYFEIID